MLRGSYADGSLAVTARCPCATTASVSAFASTAPSSGLSQVRPRRHPACPRPGSRPARDASLSRLHRYAATCSAELCHRHSRLCYSSAHQCRSLPSHGEAEQSKAFAFRRGSLLRHRNASRGLAKPFPRSAGPCCSVAMPCISKPLPSRALPSPCYALLRRRPSNHGPALPSPGPAQQSNAFAARISPSPLHAAALLRRCLRCFAPQCRSRSWHLMAELPNASAHRFVASPSRGRSLLCSSLAMTSFAALVHSFAAQRHSKPSHAAHGIALPSPRSTSQRLSFADLGSAVHFHRLAEQIKALPSPHRANQSVSFANPRNAFPSQLPAYPSFSIAGLRAAVLFFSIAALLNAKLFHRRPEQTNALPLPGLSPHLRGHAAPCCASPPPGSPSQSLSAATPSRSAPILRHAYPRNSAAWPRLAALSHRATVHPLAVPSHTIATLR